MIELLRSLTPRVTLAMLLPMLVLACAQNGTEGTASEPELLVDKSLVTIEDFMNDPEMKELQANVRAAKGVLIFPQVFKGSFILGAEGGSGVFLVRGADGSWSHPAFYTLAAGSIGFQAGGQVSEIVVTVMNEDTVDAVLDSQFKFGADAGVTVAHIGGGLEASSSTNFGFDLYAYSKSMGLFGGGAFEGGAIVKRETWNDEYYGGQPTPHDIVIHRTVANPKANQLRAALR